MPAARHHPLGSRLFRFLVLLVCLLNGVACTGARATPTAPPLPSPVPTATPHARQVLDGALFTLSLDGALMATEEIRVGDAEGQLVVFSELHRLGAEPFVERRSLVLTPELNLVRYDVERSYLGARSSWAVERREAGVDCLNNNLDWYGPVLNEGISPAPDLLLESAPSALPYTLLTLRYRQPTTKDQSTETLQLHTLDVMEDLPISRPLTVTAAPEGTGAVIGTIALEGRIEGGPNPEFTMWIRPGSRSLYGVEIEGYRFGLWRPWAPGDQAGRLEIRRVSRLPEAPVPSTPTSGTAQRQALEFSGADGSPRAGTLILPSGSGPFPCLVLHSPGGVTGRWDPGDAFATRGWAVYAYDKRGLGESEGDYDRGLVTALAQDAAAAAAMLRERPEIDPQRIIFMGLGDGGRVGALALAGESGYAAGVLGSCAAAGPVFPQLAEGQVRDVLAPFYGWDAARLSAYTEVSSERWQQWLFDRQQEVGLLGRRTSLRALREWAEFDMAQALAETSVPILLLHGGQDLWTPVEGARNLYDSLSAEQKGRIELLVLDNLGADLGSAETGALAPEAFDALLAWLESR